MKKIALLQIIYVVMVSCQNDKKYDNFDREVKYFGNTSAINKIIDFNEDGLKHGYEILFDSSGNILYIQKYLNGLPNGQSLNFAQNGNIETIINYKVGQQDGIVYNFFSNGILANEIVWRHDTFTGLMREYDSSGKQVFIHCKEAVKYHFSECPVPR